MKTLLLLLIFLLSYIDVLCQSVKVVGISEDDTFTALFADKHTERIRLHGIDTPERATIWGSSQNFLVISFLENTRQSGY